MSVVKVNLKMSKCAVEEDVSEVLQPTGNAAVQGVRTEVSHMKKSMTCSYFDGERADRKGSMRILEFHSGIRRKLVDFGEQNSCSSKLQGKAFAQRDSTGDTGHETHSGGKQQEAILCQG